jgi:hypothetical protein
LAEVDREGKEASSRHRLQEDLQVVGAVEEWLRQDRRHPSFPSNHRLTKWVEAEDLVFTL